MKQLAPIVSSILGVFLAVSGATYGGDEFAANLSGMQAVSGSPFLAPQPGVETDTAGRFLQFDPALTARPNGVRSTGNLFRQRLPTARTQKAIALPIWENVALTIPAHHAGCGLGGAVLFAVDGPRIWRGSLRCFASQASQCAATSDVTMGTANWPAVEIAGFTDRISGPDKQLVRFDDGTLLLIQQGLRRDAGTTASCETPAGTCRGAEFFFHSTDCGESWNLVSLLDPASDGPAGDPDRYYNHSTQRGHDRPELYADAFNPGRVYMTAIGWGDDVSTIVLYRSDDKGVTWQHAAELPQIWTGAYMTSLPSRLLYIASWFGAGPPHNFGIVIYDPLTGAVSGPLSVGADLYRAPVTRMATGSEGISRVGSFPDGDYLRVHNTYRTDSGDFGLVVRVIRVSGVTVSVVHEYRYVPPAGSSVVGPSVIETDRLEWRPERQLNPAFIYWYEASTTGNNGDYGPARVLGQRFDGTKVGRLHCLSLDGFAYGSCRSWPMFTDVYGDYHRGAFWYDRIRRRLGFLALWAEQTATDERSVRTNILQLIQMTDKREGLQ